MIFQKELKACLKKGGYKAAIEYNGKIISYSLLEDNAGKVTTFLLKKELEGETVVAIMLDDKTDIVSTLIGIINARCVFLLIDNRWPAARISSIVRDAGIHHLICSQKTEAISEPGLEVFYLEDLLNGAYDETNEPAYKEDDSLYIYFTSGSTGKPKGIIGKNDSLLHFIRWEIDAFEIDHTYRCSQFISPYFDAFLRDIFVPLFAGGTICIPSSSDDAWEAHHLTTWIDENRINLIHCVPSIFRIINHDSLTPEIFSNLKYIFLSGEKIIPSELVRWYRTFQDRIQIVNLYGPTETTMVKCYYKIEPADARQARIPIGFPMPGTEILILDKDLRPCNTLVPGTLYIHSAYSTKGYLNAPELMVEKFVKLQEDKIAFNTGDIARRLPNGKIDLIGRADRQIKLRGIRIEPDEIETVIIKSGLVKSAVVLLHGSANNDESLFAFVTGTHNNDPEDTLMQVLKEQLPDYMLPSRIVAVENFPLLSNGKIDVTALLSKSTPKDIILPANKTEERLLAIWKNILGDKPISTSDGFNVIGGNSLSIIRLVSSIQKEFNVKVSLARLFDNLSIQKQAALIHNSTENQLPPILPIATAPVYKVSPSLQRLWLLSQSTEGSIAYNMVTVYVLEGNLNRAALDHSFSALIERHEILRTIFMEDEQGTVWQRIHPTDKSGFRITYLDIRHTTDQEQQLKDLVHMASVLPFDLSTGPLLRAGLWQVEDNKWVFSYTMHHIISDGWSIDIMVNEIMQQYNAFLKEHSHPLPPLKIQYKDYVYWLLEQLSSEQVKVHEDYWLKQFEGDLPVLALAGGKVRPALKTYNGAEIRKRIGAEITKGIRSLSQERESTLFMGLMTTVVVLLYKYTNQEDIIIGTPIAGRVHPDLEDQIGFYLNTLSLRMRFKSQHSYKELLENTKNVTIGAYEHQIYPFGELVDALKLPGDMSRNPLFDVQVILGHNGWGKEKKVLALDGLHISGGYEEEFQSGIFDLVFQFIEIEDELQLSLQYNSDIYSGEMVTQLADHLEQIMTQVIEAPSRSIRELDCLPASEKNKLLADFEGGTTNYPKDKTLVDLLDEQASLRPEKTALHVDGIELTYRELHEWSNQFARYLQTKYNLQPDNLAGIRLNRNEWMVIAMLGVLKSGAAYIPIDPKCSLEHISYIITDSECKVLIDEKELNKFRQEQEIYLKEGLQTSLQPHHLAYVIYTPVTTGKPKGIMIEHRNVVAFLENFSRSFFLETDCVFGAITNYTSDIAVMELIGTLARGIKVVMLPVNDPVRILQHIKNHTINALFVTPSVLWQLMAVSTAGVTDLNPLKVLLVGGETLSYDSYTALKQLTKTRVLYVYGPMETTICSSSLYIRHSESLSAGSPLLNENIYIINQDSQLSPAGVTGEICIGGSGLARGYLNQPELTKERFVTNPFRNGEKMYKTGHLGRWLPDGNIEYTGNNEDQIKIGGYRIELGEIENILNGSEGVSQSVVVARADKHGNLRLIGYVIPAGRFDREKTIFYLRERLPEYMIPAKFVELAAFPLTEAGKINKHALPHTDDTDQTINIYVGPGNPTEQLLAEIWEQVLGIERAGIYDDFFKLGGHSLTLLKLLSEFKKHGYDIQLQDLFINRTIKKQANRIIRNLQEISSASQPPVSNTHLLLLKKGHPDKYLFIVPGTGGLSDSFSELAEAFDDSYTIYGLQMPGTQEGEKPCHTIEAIASQQIDWIREIQPEGPYRLMGYSFGGHVVYEMARQLEEQGFRVEMVAILDTRAVLEEIKFDDNNEADFVLDLADGYFSDFKIIKKPYPAWINDLQNSLQGLPLHDMLPRITSTLKQHLPEQERNIEMVSRLVNLRIYNALMNYIPPSGIQAPLIVFKALKSLHDDSTDDALGWASYATNIHVCILPGNHDMIRNENPDIIARFLLNNMPVLC